VSHQKDITMYCMTSIFRVNGVVVLSSMILVLDNTTASIETRKRALFRIMDFTATNDITMDELVCFKYDRRLVSLISYQEIVLFCVAMASSCILNRKLEIPKSKRIRELSRAAAAKLGKNASSLVTMEEFVAWADEVASENPDSTMYEVFRYFVPENGNIRVKDISVWDLKNKGTFHVVFHISDDCITPELVGKQDPYVSLAMGPEWSHNTEVHEGAGDKSSWSPDLTIPVTSSFVKANALKLKVKDKNDVSSDKLIGKASVDGRSLMSRPSVWVDVGGDLLDTEGAVTGHFVLKAAFTPGDAPPPPIVEAFFKDDAPIQSTTGPCKEEAITAHVANDSAPTECTTDAKDVTYKDGAGGFLEVSDLHFTDLRYTGRSRLAAVR
jgi:hypothetical protein